MKICWDNLTNLYLTRAGTFRTSGGAYIEREACAFCGEPYLALRHKNADFCSVGCSNKFREVSNCTKCKMSNTRKGKSLSAAHKRSLSKSLKGKIVSYETRLKISGENHYNWRGGISLEPYCSDWTKEYKDYIKERDNNRCQNPYCYRKDSSDLTVHHIDYDKKNCVPENLITVCRSCNSRANKDRKWHTAWYRAVITNKTGGI